MTGKDVMVIKKETADLVLSKVQKFQKDGELDLPPNYSAANALKSAWLILQNVQDKNKQPALEVCTKPSIANALLEMVIQGLNPAKKQVYFIVYGKQLTLSRSYFGNKAICMRVDKSLGDIYAEVVYQGDNLEYSIKGGKRIIETHTQKLENIDDSKILAAYAVAVDKDGDVKRSELMTMDQLMAAWKQSKMYPVTDKGDLKATSTHGKFTAEMAKKTVTNRLTKHIINSSSDSDLVINSVRRTDDDAAEALVDEEIDENANQGEVIDITPTEADYRATNQQTAPDGSNEPTEIDDEEKAEIEAEELAMAGPDF
jgi:recombination protein RecT